MTIPTHYQYYSKLTQSFRSTPNTHIQCFLPTPPCNSIVSLFQKHHTPHFPAQVWSTPSIPSLVSFRIRSEIIVENEAWNNSLFSKVKCRFEFHSIHKHLQSQQSTDVDYSPFCKLMLQSVDPIFSFPFSDPTMILTVHFSDAMKRELISRGKTLTVNSMWPEQKEGILQASSPVWSVL